ncbi:hypothetical protein BDQ17DRAFT_1327101 [Cyathus striatus]|nr:hypothetical protein BDQ17DRAFT_1327101 [Cyathus striatus]
MNVASVPFLPLLTLLSHTFPLPSCCEAAYGLGEEGKVTKEKMNKGEFHLKEAGDGQSKARSFSRAHWLFIPGWALTRSMRQRNFQVTLVRERRVLLEAGGEPA